MKIRFLLDENPSPRLKVAIQRLNPAIDILRVGEPGDPALGTLDPDILNYLATSQRLLVTSNRRSMPEHLADHWDSDGHIWGLCWVRPKTPIGKLAQEVAFIWEVSESEEWIDKLEWVPF